MLGEFNLEGIPPAPRGTPQVEVTFDIDANGILHVSAKDKATNKEQQIRIQASGGLGDDEIEKMVKDAEANADADKKRKALVEARNQAEAVIHSTEKNLAEHGDKVDDATKSMIEDALSAVKEAKDGEEPEAITEKVNELQQAAMKLGEAMYQAQQEEAAGEGEAADASAQADDGVVDADFEEVDDSKKDK